MQTRTEQIIASMNMKQSLTLILALLTLLHTTPVHTASAPSFAFFYFVQQWPGSVCDTKKPCCYPTTGKPVADFTISGLRPNNMDASVLSNCDPTNVLGPSQVKALVPQLRKLWPSLACPSNDSAKLWAYEWKSRGTCSRGVLNQHQYFQAALGLKAKANLLPILAKAGIQPNGGFYSRESISEAIRIGIGYEPYVKCNVDKYGNRQLYQVHVCADPSGSRIVDCPGMPQDGGACGSRIKFPVF